jgi:peptide/nickel transport system substrate-binding protein
MSQLNRRQFLTGAAAAAVAARAPAVHAQRRATLRFVPHADLKVLDPIWTTAYITRNHGYMIYDTLFGTDEQLRVKPQMVETWSVTGRGLRWTFTLRDGLRWHDGAPVVAEDAVESIKRWSKRDPLGKLLAAHTAKLAPVDRKTFSLDLAQPFALVLEALGKPSSNVPFIMPARVAATSDAEQIKEVIGSGPFRFSRDEWQPGYEVVYLRNPDYVPRGDAPSGSTGAKKVALDRVVWRYIPDPATASSALAAGEVDWWELPPIDFAPTIEANPALATFLQDPRGTQGWIRPNHLQPPFAAKKARQALLYMVDQRQYLQAVVGQPKYYRTCPAMFTCGGPWESAAGAPIGQDLAKAAALVRESGYDGRPVVALDATDLGLVHGAALLSRELMTKIGFAVDLQAMDWSTLVARRAKKEPPGQGGWNFLFTWWTASDLINPAVHAGISGAGAGAWFGWPENAEIERLKLEWVRTTDHARQKQLAEQIQRVAYEEVMYIPFGQALQPTAYRRSVTGVLRFPAPVFWNVSIA